MTSTRLAAIQTRAESSWLLQDDDPYVRKTAAVCVAKLHDINSELVEDRGFLDTLKVKRVPLFVPALSSHGVQNGSDCRAT